MESVIEPVFILERKSMEEEPLQHSTVPLKYDEGGSFGYCRLAPIVTNVESLMKLPSKESSQEPGARPSRKRKCITPNYSDAEQVHNVVFAPKGRSEKRIYGNYSRQNEKFYCATDARSNDVGGDLKQLDDIIYHTGITNCHNKCNSLLEESFRVQAQLHLDRVREAKSKQCETERQGVNVHSETAVMPRLNSATSFVLSPSPKPFLSQSSEEVFKHACRELQKYADGDADRCLGFGVMFAHQSRNTASGREAQSLHHADIELCIVLFQMFAYLSIIFYMAFILYQC